MNTSILIPTLATKYGIKLNGPESVMELFNKLCICLDNEQTIKNLASQYKKDCDFYNQQIINKNEIIEKLEHCLKETLKGSPINEALSSKQIKLKQVDGKLVFEY